MIPVLMLPRGEAAEMESAGSREAAAVWLGEEEEEEEVEVVEPVAEEWAGRRPLCPRALPARLRGPVSSSRHSPAPAKA